MIRSYIHIITLLSSQSDFPSVPRFSSSSMGTEDINNDE
jgi:hypothetical protein